MKIDLPIKHDGTVRFDSLDFAAPFFMFKERTPSDLWVKTDKMDMSFFAVNLDTGQQLLIEGSTRVYPAKVKVVRDKE